MTLFSPKAANFNVEQESFAANLQLALLRSNKRRAALSLINKYLLPRQSIESCTHSPWDAKLPVFFTRSNLHQVYSVACANKSSSMLAHFYFHLLHSSFLCS